MEGELRKRAERLGASGRVDFLGFVPADDLLSLYAGCRAALYAPLNEDYGYVTVEAFLSRKPVLTTSDAGGPLEFVAQDESGIVTEADAASLADGIDRVFALGETRLAGMGEAGHRRVAGISWDHVIDRLTETLR
jgi:glycosyltransferase involved in cell wall biosynthesis